VALSGLGGVGKTQTAVEYAHRYLGKYDRAFLATATSRESLLSGYVTIAGLLKLPEAGAQDETLIVDSIKRWLGSNRGWLLVLDNADRPDIVKPFLPPSPRGHILLTSRAQVFDIIGIVKPVELNEMSPAEARTFLLKPTGRECEDGPEPDAASKVAEELGFLPLALEQAGAYIFLNKSLFQDFLNSFRKRRLELLNKHGQVAGGLVRCRPGTQPWESLEIALSTNQQTALHLAALPALIKRPQDEQCRLHFTARLAPDDLPVNHRLFILIDVTASDDKTAQLWDFPTISDKENTGDLQIRGGEETTGRSR
jgi:hypothetical protein